MALKVNLHPFRNLETGTDPSVLSSNGMSVTGGADVTLAERVNGVHNPHARGSTAQFSVFSGMTLVHVADDGDGDSECVQATLSGAGPTSTAVRVVASGAVGSGSGWLACAPGDAIAALGSCKLVSITGTFIDLRLVVQFYTAEGSLITNAFIQPAITSPALGVWHRMAGTYTAPANTAWAAMYVRASHNGSVPDAVIRADRLLLTKRWGIDLSPDDYFDGESDGAEWSGTPNASTSKLVVPAYDPREGGLVDGTQAVRVYWPAGAAADDGHAFTLDLTALDTAPSLIAVLHHVRADDPGSVGHKVYAHIDYLDGDSQTVGDDDAEATLTDMPQELGLSLAVPEGAETAVMTLKRESATETNLLYSASQVSPHDIPRYKDERAYNWGRIDPEDYSAGATQLNEPSNTSGGMLMMGVG